MKKWKKKFTWCWPKICARHACGLIPKQKEEFEHGMLSMCSGIWELLFSNQKFYEFWMLCNCTYCNLWCYLLWLRDRNRIRKTECSVSLYFPIWKRLKIFTLSSDLENGNLYRYAPRKRICANQSWGRLCSIVGKWELSVLKQSDISSLYTTSWVNTGLLFYLVSQIFCGLLLF